jgi:hypothetical protein
MNMEEFLKQCPTPQSLKKIKWSEYPPSPAIKEDIHKDKNTSSAFDITIWSLFQITKNECDKVSIDEAYTHYLNNTKEPLSKIKFSKSLLKISGIKKGILFIGRDKEGYRHSSRCYTGLKLRSIQPETNKNIIQPYLIDL